LTAYGFNFGTLYCLDLGTLYDVVCLIRGEEAHIAADYDVMIRGCIIPFLRDAARTPKGTDKDTIMRRALIVTAKRLKIGFKDWDNVDTEDIADAARRQVQAMLAERLEELTPEDQAEVLNAARNDLAESAKTMGLPLAGAGFVAAGELSGFGIYLATTTGLKALSLALGTTFSWGVYQGATALLGVILGPVGWAVAGIAVAGSLALSIVKWMNAKREHKLLLVVIALLLAIGENPYRFFGLGQDASFAQIRSAYRAVMKTLHPDRLEKDLPQWLYDDFGEKLLRCQEAYQKLEQTYDRRSDGENAHD
jgi:hypothetical protein